MLQSTEHCHIVRNSEILGGEPIIRGTRTPVRAIVEMWRIGVSPEERDCSEFCVSGLKSQ
jgi:uncharacterized protein (DUF433 family)